MNAELEGFLDQLLSIQQDVPGIVAGLSEARFNWRPAPNRWSIAECFDHLNLTARAFVPAIDAALRDARARKLDSPGPFSYSLFERMFRASNEPPVRVRFRAPKALTPTPAKPLDAVLAEFMDWQRKIVEQVRSADGFHLARAQARSPVFAPLRWSLGSLFAITLAHERRHIWQARQVRNALNFPQP